MQTKNIPQDHKQLLLVDQGTDDEMYDSLRPESLRQACENANYPLQLRLRKGYDHGYYFVASFIEEHLRFHAKALEEALQNK